MEAQCRWYLETLPLGRAVVADVGANVGEISAFCVRAGAARVISVEPLAVNADALEARIAAEGAGAVWSLARCAVSDHAGEVWLRLGGSEETPHNAVVTARAEGPAVRVPCATLPALCPDATVVKLDIEGHEYAVLDQCLGTMTSVRAWALELHMVPQRPLQATLQALAALGFTLVGAGRRRGDPTGRWVSAPVPPTMTWDELPVAQHRPGGGVFKMFHVIARR